MRQICSFLSLSWRFECHPRWWSILTFCSIHPLRSALHQIVSKTPVSLIFCQSLPQKLLSVLGYVSQKEVFDYVKKCVSTDMKVEELRWQESILVLQTELAVNMQSPRTFLGLCRWPSTSNWPLTGCIAHKLLSDHNNLEKHKITRTQYWLPGHHVYNLTDFKYALACKMTFLTWAVENLIRWNYVRWLICSDKLQMPYITVFMDSCQSTLEWCKRKCRQTVLKLK